MSQRKNCKNERTREDAETPPVLAMACKRRLTTKRRHNTDPTEPVGNQSHPHNKRKTFSLSIWPSTSQCTNNKETWIHQLMSSDHKNISCSENPHYILLYNLPLVRDEQQILADLFTLDYQSCCPNSLPPSPPLKVFNCWARSFQMRLWNFFTIGQQTNVLLFESKRQCSL